MNPENENSPEEQKDAPEAPLKSYPVMTAPVEFERIDPKVEAIQFSGTFENVKAVEHFFGGEMRVRVKHTITHHWSEDTGSNHHRLHIEFEDPYILRDRDIDLQTWDWIVRVVDRGQHRVYAMSDESFQKEFRPKGETKS